MLGVFDSGVGGLSALAVLRKLLKNEDLVFFADKENAPYGTKTSEELASLVKSDVEQLFGFGAEKILMACCTASTVYDRLPKWQRDICYPIIEPTADAAAAATKNGIIGVLATEATVRSEAFTNALLTNDSVKNVIEIPARDLVTAIENGARDLTVSPAQTALIDGLVRPLRESGADTLVLGCTHFPHLEKTIGALMPGVKLISSSEEGARNIAKHAKNTGKGRTFYI